MSCGVTALSPALVNDLSRFCACLTLLTCTLADIADPVFNPQGKPTLTIPGFQIDLAGQAVRDAAVTRAVSETVRATLQAQQAEAPVEPSPEDPDEAQRSECVSWSATPEEHAAFHWGLEMLRTVTTSPPASSAPASR